MLLSIIIPIYNKPIKAIERCFLSINQLRDFNYEVIIIDDGSDEIIGNFCREYANNNSQFSYFFQNNMGVSFARNRGLEEARGKFVMFVDSDDEIVAENITDFFTTIESEDSNFVDLIVFDKLWVKGKEKKISHELQDNEEKNNEDLLISMILKSRLSGVIGNIYRKKFLEVNNIKFDKSLIQGEDRDFNFRVILKKPHVKHIDKAGYCYYFQLMSASMRWKYYPDKMLVGGEMCYQRQKTYVLDSDLQRKEEVLEYLSIKRINSIYMNVVDLYCADQMTKSRKKQIQEMLRQWILPESANEKTKKRYVLLERGKWFNILLYARVRNIYMKGMDFFQK